LRYYTNNGSFFSIRLIGREIIKLKPGPIWPIDKKWPYTLQQKIGDRKRIPKLNPPEARPASLMNFKSTHGHGDAFWPQFKSKEAWQQNFFPLSDTETCLGHCYGDPPPACLSCERRSGALLSVLLTFHFALNVPFNLMMMCPRARGGNDAVGDIAAGREVGVACNRFSLCAILESRWTLPLSLRVQDAQNHTQLDFKPIKSIAVGATQGLFCWFTRFCGHRGINCAESECAFVSVRALIVCEMVLRPFISFSHAAFFLLRARVFHFTIHLVRDESRGVFVCLERRERWFETKVAAGIYDLCTLLEG
jgi:hypothetical protein